MLATYIRQPHLSHLIRRFLYDQLYPHATLSASQVNITRCPILGESFKIRVFHSAMATYYAPSDDSGIGGMHRSRIRAAPSWRMGPPRNDCIFAENDPAMKGFRGLFVAQVSHFFSFRYRSTFYPCALVQWFVATSDSPCGDTGMWVVKPELDGNQHRVTSIIHLDCIVRGAHLIGVYGNELLPHDFKHTDSLTAFHAYHVNKFADHHANEIAF